MDKHAYLQRNPQMIAVDMDGQKVMMSAESGDYFGINKVGSYIWDMLEEPITIVQILYGVKEAFEIDFMEDAKDDIMDFLNELQSQNLIFSKKITLGSPPDISC